MGVEEKFYSSVFLYKTKSKMDFSKARHLNTCQKFARLTQVCPAAVQDIKDRCAECFKNFQIG